MGTIVPPKSPARQKPATAQAQTQARAKPVASYKYGSVSAAIFANEVKTQSGEVRLVHQVSLRRSYKTAAGWSHSQSLRLQDLLPAALALVRCYEVVSELDGGGQDEDGK